MRHSTNYSACNEDAAAAHGNPGHACGAASVVQPEERVNLQPKLRDA